MMDPAPAAAPEDGVAPEQHDDADALAQRVGAHMLRRDAAARMMGIALERIAAGQARMSMRVREDMLNGHGMCHGGFIFTLADTCFAYACNSRNSKVVASACMIDFLAPAGIGDTLVAEATEQSVTGRTGIYDIVVTGAAGAVIALFRGKSHRISGEVLEQVATLDRD